MPVPQKRKAIIDSASLQLDDDDLYTPDPKVKKLKAGAISQKMAASRGELKAKGVSVKGKAKEASRKEKGKQAKKGIKNVESIEDQDGSSLEEAPQTSRPKPKPAYTGADGQKGSKFDFQ
jgi:hypothetical protein